MHYAEVDPTTNQVLRVIVCDSKDWCEKNLGGTWVRTYYSTPGKNYAGQGYLYYPDLDNFGPPQPYPSWTLNPEKLTWDPPAPYPDDGKLYAWDEASLAWVSQTEVASEASG